MLIANRDFTDEIVERIRVAVRSTADLTRCALSRMVSEARGTWLESHFDWQIRTFWYALAWALLVGMVSLPLALVIIGFGTWAVGMFMLCLWAIYRIARGWLRLNAHQPMRA